MGSMPLACWTFKCRLTLSLASFLRCVYLCALSQTFDAELLAASQLSIFRHLITDFGVLSVHRMHRATCGRPTKHLPRMVAGGAHLLDVRSYSCISFLVHVSRYAAMNHCMTIFA